MTTKEQIRAIIQQYADKGERLFLEASESNESYAESYWDGYKDCADGLLRELEDIKEEPEYLEEETTYCAFSTSRYTDKDRKALCKGCEEECKFNKKEELGLNWKDMREIDRLSGSLLTLKGNSDDKEFYQEVLKRFKDLKK